MPIRHSTKLFRATGAILLLTLAGCSSNSVITEFDSEGRLVRRIETVDSPIREGRLSLENKNVMIFAAGFRAEVKATPASMENGGAATLEGGIVNGSSAYVSIRQGENPETIRAMAAMASAIRCQQLQAGTTGIAVSTETTQ